MWNPVAVGAGAFGLLAAAFSHSALGAWTTAVTRLSRYLTPTHFAVCFSRQYWKSDRAASPWPRYVYPRPVSDVSTEAPFAPMRSWSAGTGSSAASDTPARSETAKTAACPRDLTIIFPSWRIHST